MKFALVTLAAVGSVAAFAAPAAAASGDVRETAWDAGRCIVKADRDAAIDLLKRLPLANGDQPVALGSLGKGQDCIAGPLPAEAVFALRGGLAQQLFVRDFGEFGTTPRRAIGELAAFRIPVEKDPMDVDDRTRNLYMLGDCIARSDTPDTEKLLKSGYGSQTEMNVIETLGPLMSACEAHGGQIAIGRSELRSVVAQAAYHVAQRYATGTMVYAGAK